ncbi:discoidin/SUN/FTP domain-containing protein [Acetobacter ascendens]|uniref:hypothetical protein n=1 Tax=Acetobacter ascendens TaxID=481146 RepID=UPI000875B699|nr:hypothetical protein [Acetobacter ascendens]AOW49375.1 hypothetical protein A4R89_08070 [Acetobacter ascendens]
MSYAAFFKTHKWDDIIERQYNRVRENVSFGDVYILFDTTHSCADNIPEKYRERVVSINTKDIFFLGLPELGSFWFNGDYSSIIAFTKKPEYEYYCFIEYDVFTNKNIDEIFVKMQEDKIDIIGEDIETPNYNWPHISSCCEYYDDLGKVKKSLFCVGFFSRRALVAFYARRLEQKEICDRLNLDYVPIGEAVMTTEAELSGLTYENLHNFCDNLEYYDWNNGCTEEMISNIGIGETFIHPVYDYEKFVKSNFFMGQTKVSHNIIKKLKHVKDANVFSIAYYMRDNTDEDRENIFNIFKENMSGDYAYLNDEIVSYEKKATQSSFSDYSVSSEEAARALNLIPRNTYSFHTDQEQNPWWLLDLEDEILVKDIYLFDRPDVGGFRSQNLQVLIGEDLENMKVIFENPGQDVLSNVKIPVNAVIRYVKCMVNSYSILHLDTVIVTS